MVIGGDWPSSPPTCIQKINGSNGILCNRGIPSDMKNGSLLNLYNIKGGNQTTQGVPSPGQGPPLDRRGCFLEC